MLNHTIIKSPKFRAAETKQFLLRRNLWLVLFGDTALIALAHYMAYMARFEGNITSYVHQITNWLPFLIIVKLSVFYFSGLYRGMWRYTSLNDLFNIIRAVSYSSGIVILTVLYFNRFEGLSRSVFMLDGVFTFLLLCFSRGSIRYALTKSELFSVIIKKNKKQNKIRLLLIGAGAASEKVIREIKDNKNVSFIVVGLIDDNTKKHGLKMHGIPVLGGVDNLNEYINRTRAEEILITIASASGPEMKRIVNACQKSKLKFKVLPSMGEIIKGRLAVSSSREIAFKDLLGRPVVHLDQKEIGSYLTGQTILVTGAGGSIGSELCRQIIKFEPKQVILFDAGEENLYKIEMEFKHEYNSIQYVSVLGKIQNRYLLNSIFCKYAPTVIFHAAAYKHVPLVEANPWEGVFNNVFAVRNLIETAIHHRAKRFVLVSTDKAVRPTNVMGATKRLTELLMLAYASEMWDDSMPPNSFCKSSDNCEKESTYQGTTLNHHTKFMAVRFGNVLGSSGSVIPLFKKQIEQGGPVTITDPEITRYFMSVEEASQLILQAGAMGNGGEIFILKMGVCIKIKNLAEDLIRLMGYEPEKDIKLAYTGLRPGEKLYEELITDGEGIVPTPHAKIMVLRGDGKPYEEMEILLSELATCAKAHDGQGIKLLLNKIIPEYTPDFHAKSVIETNETAH